MHILSVILLSKKSRKKTLDYFTSKETPVGAIVSIPLRTSREIALVISSRPARASKANLKKSDFSLKKIERVHGHSLLSESYINALVHTARRLALTEEELLFHFFPSAMRDIHLPAPLVYPIEAVVRPEKLLFQAPLDERILFYKTFIRQSFARKGSVFLMVPTIRDTTRFAELLSRGIEDFVIVLHGELSKKEQVRRLELCSKENHPLLVIGTPSFLGAKSPLSALIIEEEHSRHYRSVLPPHIDNRVFAEIYASLSGTTCIIADTLVRTETLGRYFSGELGEVAPLSFRRTSASIEERLLSSSKEDRTTAQNSATPQKWSLITPSAEKEIRRTVENGGHVFIFSLRKDIAHTTLCNNCGSAVTCTTCSAPLILRKNTSGKEAQKTSPTEFFCPRCRRTEASLRVCTTCGGWNLTALGMGVDRITEELNTLFPDTPVFCADEKSTSKKNEQIVASWHETKGSILVGNESFLARVGTDADMTLVVSMDSLFSVPDFRIADRILHLLFDIRKTTQKLLLIQTKNPDEELLSIKAGGILSDFCKKELEERKEWNYPPFSRFIKVTWKGKAEKEKIAKQELTTLFTDYQPVIQKEEYTGRGTSALKMLLKLPTLEWTSPAENNEGTIDEKLLSLLRYLPREYTVIVDPETLL